MIRAHAGPAKSGVVRVEDPNTADDAHAALVRAVADGHAEAAAEILRGELEDPFGS